MTVAKTLLDLIPQLLRHDRLVLAVVDSALMADPPDIDRVRQDLVDMASAERTAARRPACAIDADRKPKALSVQLLFETNYASSLEISPEEECTISA
jgi:hypothetical protein